MKFINSHWTAEEDDKLRRMWTNGIPTTDIASKIGHCRSHVYKRAALIGLPGRPRGGSGPRRYNWSAEIDATIRRLWAEGLGELAIGIEVDLPRDRVRMRAEQLGLAPRSKQTRRQSKTVEIPCLRCRNTFPSVDRRANRICQPCKDRRSWRRGDFIYNTDHEVRL